MFLFGFIGGALATALVRSLWPMVLLPALVFVAKNWCRNPLCSGCEQRLAAVASTCDNCGGTVAGSIRDRRELHDAEDRYWAERGGGPEQVFHAHERADEDQEG
jgi:predicted amidophosphoribosyltransferase